MYSFLSRYGQLIGLGVGVLITLIFFVIILANGGTFEELRNDPLNDTPEKFLAALSQTSIFDIGINAAIALTLVGVIAMFSLGGLKAIAEKLSHIENISNILMLAAIALGTIFFLLFTLPILGADAKMTLAKVGLGIGGLLALVGLGLDFQNSKGVIIGIVVIIALYFLGTYALNPADSEDVLLAITKNNNEVLDAAGNIDPTALSYVSESKSASISGGLIMTGLILVISVVSLIGSEIWSMFR